MKKKNLHEENYLFLVVCQMPSSNGAGSLKKYFSPILFPQMTAEGEIFRKICMRHELHFSKIWLYS